MVNAVLLSDNDMVVTVTRPISCGEDIIFTFNGRQSLIKAVSDIPINHKAAIVNIKKGDPVLKYGERIGYAIADIREGEHVHTNNLDSRINNN
jgi:altronate dehydratase small subunit